MPLILSGPMLLGLAAIGAGILTLIAHRPLVLSHRWVFLALWACFVPELVILLLVEPSPRSVLQRSLGPSLVAAVAVLCWLLLKGYMVFGATEQQLDAAMAEALAGLEQPFEKTPDGVRLTAQDAAVEARMGLQDVWSLSISPWARRPTLVALAKGMRASFASRVERSSRAGSYRLLAGGAAILLLKLGSIVLGL